MLVIVGAANAVNLTDGLDGLAIMPVMIAAASLGVIAYVVGRVDFTDYLDVHYVPDTGELLIFVAGADRRRASGSCGTTRPPAAVFMGDTGSLALGGALGAIAVATKHEIVLAIVGGLFVVEALSVIIQVAYFKRTKQAGLPDGADPPPFREEGLGRAADRDPVLDHLADPRDDRAGHAEDALAVAKRRRAFRAPRDAPHPRLRGDGARRPAARVGPALRAGSGARPDDPSAAGPLLSAMPWIRRRQDGEQSMIAVPGFEGHKVAVLGLGRSGLAAARALTAGGAEPIVWDDGAEGRGRAEAEGFTLRDLTRDGAFRDVACLVVSPGIPHLYPRPNPGVRAALEAGVPVDNDIGLFFRALATGDWDTFETAPRVAAITGSNGKSTTIGADPPLPHRRWAPLAAGRATSAAACSTSTRRGTATSWCWNCHPTRPTSPGR